MKELIDNFDSDQYENFYEVLNTTKTRFDSAKTTFEFQKIVLNGIKETPTPFTLLQGKQNCNKIRDSV